MRRGERSPRHRHEDGSSGGRGAAHTGVQAAGGGSGAVNVNVQAVPRVPYCQLPFASETVAAVPSVPRL